MATVWLPFKTPQTKNSITKGTQKPSYCLAADISPHILGARSCKGSLALDQRLACCSLVDPWLHFKLHCVHYVWTHYIDFPIGPPQRRQSQKAPRKVVSEQVVRPADDNQLDLTTRPVMQSFKSARVSMCVFCVKTGPPNWWCSLWYLFRPASAPHHCGFALAVPFAFKPASSGCPQKIHKTHL